MKKALSFDVGGTKIYHTIVDDSGNIISDIVKCHTPKTFEDIQALFKGIIEKYEDEVDLIAFSTCGAVNIDNSRILGSTGNITDGYYKMDFERLSKKTVFVENDANCAAWAEFQIGASKGLSNSVMITLGTGVGGGIIVDGRILKGKNGAAGEMHFKIRSDKHRKCSCASYDCFEIYASGTGLRLTAVEMLGDENVTTYDVIEKKSEPKMAAVLNKWQDDILIGLVGLANLFDPDCIVLSGSMAEFVDTSYLTDEVNKQIVTTPTKVVKAKAGNYCGMIGAALLAFNKRG